jgi:hypothetical protein
LVIDSQHHFSNSNLLKSLYLQNKFKGKAHDMMIY